MNVGRTDFSACLDKDSATKSRRDIADVLNVIYAAIADLNLQLAGEQQLRSSPDTALFGDGGNLDSLALANFIVIAEQKFEERFGFRIDLTQDDPFCPATGHFKTIASLAAYISSLVRR